MLQNILVVVLLLALVVFFIWLAARARRARRGYVRWPGLVLAGLFALVFAAAAVLAGIGLAKINTPASNRVTAAHAPATADKIARGERLAMSCIDCHSSTGNLPLDGSKADIAQEFGAPPMGDLWAPNLTPAGPLKDWSDGEIIRAIREGVGKNGRPLLIMPSISYRALSDADVQALVAYLRSQPPVGRNVPATNPNVLAALFIGSGVFPTSVQPPIDGPQNAPPAGVTPEYGAYLVNVSGCRDCHGKDLAGHTASGPLDTPSAPNLRGTAGTWSAAEFVKTIRTGVDPLGHQLNTDMPWQSFNKTFTDDELAAIHSYIVSLH